MSKNEIMIAWPPELEAQTVAFIEAGTVSVEQPVPPENPGNGDALTTVLVVGGIIAAGVITAIANDKLAARKASKKQPNSENRLA